MSGDNKKELEFSDKVNFIVTGLRGYAYCFLPFTRYKMGVEALGISGVVAFVIQLIYIQVTQDMYMVRHLGMWFVFVVLQRLGADKTANSQFEGYSMLRKFFPFIRTEEAAKTIEAISVMCWGALFLTESEHLAKFWFLGGIVMLIMNKLDAFAVSRRLQKMQDQEIEMRDLHERYGQMKGRVNGTSVE